MSYGNDHFRRGLPLWLCLLALVLAVNARAAQVTFTDSIPGPNECVFTYTWSVSNLVKVDGQWQYSYSRTLQQSPMSGNYTGSGTNATYMSIGLHNASGYQPTQANRHALSVILHEDGAIASGSGIGKITVGSALHNSLDQGNPMRIWFYPYDEQGNIGFYHPGINLASGADIMATLRIPPNDTEFAQVFRVLQNGQVVAEFMQAPGEEPKIAQVVVPTTDPVTVVALVEDLTRDGPSWVVQEGAVSEIGPVKSGIQPTADPEQTPVDVPAPNIPNVEDPTKEPDPTGTNQAEKPIWDGSTDDKADDGLTNATFKQGVDKLAEIWSKSGSGSGGDVDLSGVESRLDGVNSRLDESNTHLSEIAAAAETANQRAEERETEETTLKGEVETTKATLGDGSAKASEGVQSAQQRAGDMQTAGTTALQAFGTGPNLSGAQPGAAPGGSIPIKVSQGVTVQVPKNPFSGDGPFGGVMGSVATLVRRLIAWGTVVAFFSWCLGRVRAMCALPFNVAPFGTSLSDALNSIRIFGFGGGIGYAARLVVFTLTATVLLSMPVAVMAAITAGLPWADLTAIYGAGPVSGAEGGMLGEALALADLVVPWVLLISTPVYYFLVEFILFPSQLFWQMFIKFIPS